MTRTILVVEDDPHIADNLEYTLNNAGYAVHVTGDGFSALYQASLTPPDLILLDLGLPDMNGEQVLQQVREASQVPVVVLTAYDNPEDRNILLHEGASDYLLKPYREEELLACLDAQLNPRAPTRSLVFGPLEFDLAARRVCCSGKKLVLLGTEFDLLLTLARQPGRVMTVDELAQRVHLKCSRGIRQLIQVQMGNIREALRDAGEPALLRTVREMGYALVPPVSHLKAG